MSEHFASAIGPWRRPATWFDWKRHNENQPDYHEVLHDKLKRYGDARDADAVQRIVRAALRFFSHAAFTPETTQELDKWLQKRCELLPSAGTVQTAADKALMIPLVSIAEMLEEANAAPKSELPPAGSMATLADDTAAYVPVSELIDDDFPTFKTINNALEANPSIRWRRPTGTNGKPIPNRKEIHVGDWHRFKRQREAGDPLDNPAAIVDAVLDVEKRKEEIRKPKGEAGK